MTAYAFGEPISIADDLGGDTSVLPYVHNECHYSDDTLGIKWFDKGVSYDALVEKLMMLMDESLCGDLPVSACLRFQFKTGSRRSVAVTTGCASLLVYF